MSKFNSVLVTKASGKIGDIVISKWRDKKVLRAYVPNVNGKTEAARLAQSYARLRMRQWSRNAAFVRSSVYIIFSQRLKRKTEFSAYIQYMLKATNQAGALLTTKLNNAQIGNGVLQPTVPLTVTAGAGKTLVITWAPTGFPPGFPSTTATVSALIVVSTGENAAVIESATLFSTGTATFTCGANFKAGDICQVFLGVKNVLTLPLSGLLRNQYSKMSGLSVAAFKTLLA